MIPPHSQKAAPSLYGHILKPPFAEKLKAPGHWACKPKGAATPFQRAADSFRVTPPRHISVSKIAF